MTARSRPVVVTGNPVEVRAALERARDDGRLLAVRDAELVDGRARVVAEMAVPTRDRLLVHAPTAVVAAVAVVGAAIVGAVVWAVVVLVGAVVAWVTAHLPAIIGGAVVLGGLALWAAGSGRVHCPGCPR